ncbi:hypothetical protein mRhiFer1_010085 [Rhinolophus ferrumequinum]|uniref:Uncharacterized protein n=1 Tax=Rhinolophus ferrumequinum TaxID=59479 RepID=A0A7J7XPK7_RHIFE|nr:hypothetical protein mRhiFer1_010085 [Rhinolophus ferrumequinum]
MPPTTIRALSCLRSSTCLRGKHAALHSVLSSISGTFSCAFLRREAFPVCWALSPRLGRAAVSEVLVNSAPSPLPSAEGVILRVSTTCSSALLHAVKYKFPPSPSTGSVVTSALLIPRESTSASVCAHVHIYTQLFSVQVSYSALDTPKVWTSAHTHTKWLHSFALASRMAPHRDLGIYLNRRRVMATLKYHL